MRCHPRRRDSGFALLLVFLMAAVIAISMYIEIPRIAFDSQRQKEQLLIERGEQYKRGIELFFKANKKYPASIDELENFNSRRFLRHRYKDPMTGKEEWRLVHIQNGMLTDSVTMKQQGRPGDQSISNNSGQYISEAPAIGTSGAGTGPGGAALAQNRRRASDNAPPGGPGNGAMVDPSSNPNPDQTGVPPGTVPMPGSVPTGVTPVPGGQPGMPPVFQPGMPTTPGAPTSVGPNGQPIQPGVPGQQFTPGQPGRNFPGQLGFPTPGTIQGGSTGSSSSSGSSYMGGGGYMGGTPTTTPAPVYPGQLPPNFPGAPGMPVNSQGGGVSPSPYPVTPGQNTPGATPFPQPGGTLNQQSNNAVAGLIGNILFNPRPGGGTAPGNTNGLGPVIGGGIAGIASTAEADGIMVYNDRTNYGEWEFIFDPSKVKKIQNPNGGTIGTPANQLGSNPGTNPGMNPIQPGQPVPQTGGRYDGGYGTPDPSIRAGRQ